MRKRIAYPLILLAILVPFGMIAGTSTPPQEQEKPCCECKDECELKVDWVCMCSDGENHCDNRCTEDSEVCDLPEPMPY